MFNETKKKEGRSAFTDIEGVLNVLMYLLSGLIRIWVFVLSGSKFIEILL